MVVVGGGITGVHIARELAGRGVSVLLVEQSDLGSGASSAAVLPGGWQDVARADIRVAAELARERRTLLLAAPHLVRSRRVVVPTWDEDGPGRAAVGTRLVLGEALSATTSRRGPARSGRLSWLSARSARSAAPWLRTDGLTGAVAVDDTISEHPARLVLAVARSAVDLGADVLTHASLTRVVTEPGPVTDTVCAVEITDRLSGAAYVTATDVVVNAAGSSVRDALGDLGPRSGLAVRRARSVHVLTHAVGGRDTVITRTQSGEPVAVSPWRGMSVVASGDVLEDRPSAADVDRVLAAAADVMRHPVTADEVIGTVAVERPALEDRIDGTYRSADRVRLDWHDGSHITGVLTVTGGTWTSARASGATVADALLRATRIHPARRFDSRVEPLHAALAEADRSRLATDLLATGVVDGPTADHLTRLYGSDAAAVADLVRADPRLGRRLSSDPARGDIAAQAVFAVTHEAAQTVDDVALRRLSGGVLGAPGHDELIAIAAVVGPLLGRASATEDGATTSTSDSR